MPVYRVSAEMCNAARMAPNNEVRIGGNRVGVIESIETIPLEQASGCQTAGGDSATAAARLNLKLDETAKPLPEDSTVRVRYRSSFGLKYLEIERGSGEGLPEGGNLPLAQAEPQTEFDDIANTFDTPTRENSRIVLEGFGNAFAARGASLNLAIESLNPLFDNLRPVAQALSDPTTRLEKLLPRARGRGSDRRPGRGRQRGAVRQRGDRLRRDLLRRGGAQGHDLRPASRPSRPGSARCPVQAPFLRDFAEFSRLLRPGVRDLRLSLPILNDVIAKGAKVLPRTVQMNTDLQAAFVELEELVDAGRTSLPNAAPPGTATLASLQRLGTTFDEVNSAGSKIIPAQTVCNYWNYWFQFLPEHFSGQSTFGLAERLIGPGDERPQHPRPLPAQPPDLRRGLAGGRAVLGLLRPTRPTALPKEDPAGDFDPLHPNANPPPASRSGDPDDDVEQIILHGSAYGPTGTESAPNCQAGQYGLPMGELLSPGRTVTAPRFGAYNVSAGRGRAALRAHRPLPAPERSEGVLGLAMTPRPTDNERPLQPPDRADRDRGRP